MKKIFTLTMLLGMTLGVSAQEATTYRKSWDFTKWSTATIANLKADNNWTNDEKGDGSKIEGFVNDKQCVWEAEAKASEEGYVVANDVVISELSGLTYLKPAAKGLAIATAPIDWVARDGANFGPYKSDQFLWLCSKNKNYFVIPHVELGTTIKMGIETHKYTSSRGVTLYIGQDNNGTALADPFDGDGNAISGGNTAGYADMTWTVPTEIETTNADGTVDICVRCNNGGGMHIYYITVGDGDGSAVVEAKNVAYIGDESEEAFSNFDRSIVNPTAISIDAIPAIDSLQKYYDAVVIGTTPTADQLKAVKGIIAFMPVVNTNPTLYEALGYGTTTEINASAMTVKDVTNPIFEELGEEIECSGLTAVTLGDYFAKDDTLGICDNQLVMHVHNAGRNAYYFVPFTPTQGMLDLLTNTIVAASKTKRAVAAVGTPAITFKQNDGNSTVTITATNSNAIYYTLDGTDPTIASTLYTEPFILTDSLNVKAFATGDGYTDSKVAEQKIAIAVMATKPIIALAKESGKTTVTITGQEGSKLYYNFNKTKKSAESKLYSEPIVLTEPTTIYALAEGDGLLTSDLAGTYVAIDGVNKDNIRLDTLAHFDANQEDWFVVVDSVNGTGKVSAYYYWGKNAWNYYSTEVDHQEAVKDADGNIIKSQVNPEQDSMVNVYKPNPEALKIVKPANENGWVLKSQGQVLTGELQLAPAFGIGNGATGRYAEEPTDLIGTPSTGVITFGGKTSGEPYSARIESTEKLQGPFDVIVFCGNGNNGSAAVMVIQTSEDGENWNTLDTLKMASTQRYYKRTRAAFNEEKSVFVRVAHINGATKAQVYDIFVMNNGEYSKAYDAAAIEKEVEEALGISTVAVKTRRPAAIYSINGTRQQSLRRGLNIVVGVDGKVRKVMVK